MMMSDKQSIILDMGWSWRQNLFLLLPLGKEFINLSNDYGLEDGYVYWW